LSLAELCLDDVSALSDSRIKQLEETE
jgi:hypothetical protein